MSGGFLETKEPLELLVENICQVLEVLGQETLVVTLEYSDINVSSDHI